MRKYIVDFISAFSGALSTTAANLGKRCRCGNDGGREKRYRTLGRVNIVAVVAGMLILFPPAAAGQNTVTIFSEETQGYERIGTALIECTYLYAWLQDTTSGTRMTPEGTLLSGDSTDIAEDVMLLQCGGPDGISRFYSYSQYYRDSLITSLVQSGTNDFSSVGDVKGGTSMQLFKDRADDDDRQDAGLVRGGGGRAGFRLGRD